MKFTRDSILWIFGVVGGVITGVLGQMNVISGYLTEMGVMPATAHKWQAVIGLVGLMIGIISGVLKASPLSLSPDNPMARHPEQTLNVVTNDPRPIDVTGLPPAAREKIEARAQQIEEKKVEEEKKV